MMFSGPEMRAKRLYRLLIVAWALTVAALSATASNAQTSPAQGLAVKADIQTLCALIGKKQVIALRYHYDPSDASPQELHPYAVGYTRKRDVLLFGLQIDGYSKSAKSGTNKLPGWRNFRLDRIKSVDAVNTTFNPVQPNTADYRAISEFACRNDSVGTP